MIVTKEKASQVQAAHDYNYKGHAKEPNMLLFPIPQSHVDIVNL